jgi:DNA-binding NarL/FixJ family response regulator
VHRTESASPRDDEHDDHLTELVERCKAITTLREGATNREIATTIFLSEETVKSHVKMISQKFGVANRAQVVATYLESLERRPAPGDVGRRQ